MLLPGLGGCFQLRPLGLLCFPHQHDLAQALPSQLYDVRLPHWLKLETKANENNASEWRAFSLAQAYRTGNKIKISLLQRNITLHTSSEKTSATF